MKKENLMKKGDRDGQQGTKLLQKRGKGKRENRVRYVVKKIEMHRMKKGGVGKNVKGKKRRTRRWGFPSPLGKVFPAGERWEKTEKKA